MPHFVVKQPASRGSIVQSGSQVVVLDVTGSEQHAWSSSLTKHPVATGANINEHIHDEGVTVDVTGRLTDTPQNLLEWRVGRAIEQLEKLLSIRDAKASVTLTTGIRVYQDMILTGIRVNRGGRPRMSIDVSLSFEQLRRFRALVTFVPEEVLADDEVTRSAPADDGVDQTTDETDTAEGDAVRSSTLAQGADGISGLFGGGPVLGGPVAGTTPVAIP
jgi:hypothetical protein